VEMFLAFSLVLFIFAWLANFLDAYYSTATASPVFFQEKGIASGLARLANTACVTNMSITTTLPCVFAGANPISSYDINASGNPAAIWVHATASSAAPASARVLCSASGAFPIQCTGTTAGEACIRIYNGSVKITQGACP